MDSTMTNPSLSHAVVEAVADAEDADILDLEVPLYEAVDPDALNSLFAATNDGHQRTGRVVFEYAGHTVVVASDGTVTLTEEPTVSEESL